MEDSGSGSGGGDRPSGRSPTGPSVPASAKVGRSLRSGRIRRTGAGRSSGNYAPIVLPPDTAAAERARRPEPGPRSSPPGSTGLAETPEAVARASGGAPEPGPSAPAASGGPPSTPAVPLSGPGFGRRPADPKKSHRRSRLRRIAQLGERLPVKIPETIESGIEKGIEGIEKGIEGIGKGVNATVDILKDPIGSVQKVVDAVQAPRGLAMGWAIALLLPFILYFLDLGAGSLWQGADAQFALALQDLASGQLRLDEAARSLPPPRGTPLGLWQMALTVRLLGANEATLRLLPVLAALGSAACLLAIAIDVGVGRHAGGLAGLVLLSLPLTYQLSHRVLPDMLVAAASTGAVALVCHSLHGHKFDRHILPIHRDTDGPAPLPLRRLPMLFASLGIGLAALVDPRAGFTAIAFALLDMLISHRYLFRRRRVWLMLGGAVLFTVLATLRHPTELWTWLRWPTPGAPLRTFMALWHQGDTRFSRYIGRVVVVATGFGLLLGSLRRASRPLLVWVLVAASLTWLGDDSELPRGLGLVLPPLALCAAVGLQSPVRWLGALGGVITACALFGVVVVNIEGGPVLHNSDTIKILTASQQHAPPGALLCTVGIPPQVSTFYAHRPIAEFGSVEELAKALAPGQLFSCVVPQSLLSELQRRLAPPERPARRPAEAAGPPGKSGGRGKEAKGRPAPPPERKDEPLEGLGSVLATTLDVEEPPIDTQGPKVVLVSR